MLIKLVEPVLVNVLHAILHRQTVPVVRKPHPILTIISLTVWLIVLRTTMREQAFVYNAVYSTGTVKTVRMLPTVILVTLDLLSGMVIVFLLHLTVTSISLELLLCVQVIVLLAVSVNQTAHRVRL